MVELWHLVWKWTDISERGGGEQRGGAHYLQGIIQSKLVCSKFASLDNITTIENFKMIAHSTIIICLNIVLVTVQMSTFAIVSVHSLTWFLYSGLPVLSLFGCLNYLLSFPVQMPHFSALVFLYASKLQSLNTQLNWEKRGSMPYEQ